MNATNIEQSKKLAEILPLESADMHWQDASKEYKNPYGIYDRCFRLVAGNSSKIINNKHDFKKGFILPAWSLTALFEVLHENKICHYNDRYYCQYITEGSEFPIYSTAEYDNPVDACYELILKLYELKTL